MQTDNKVYLDKIAINRIGNYHDRPTIIFLHDSLGCIELWRDFPQKLGELTKCNVIAYDRQGYGKSPWFSYSKRDNNYMEEEADILNELLEHWGIGSVILFGHSDGGSIALIFAGKYQKKVVGIITEGAHIFVEKITVTGIKDSIKLYQTTDLKSKLEKYHGNKTEEMFWAWAKTWTTKEFKTWNIEHFLPKILCHSLIIQGEDDEYGTIKQVQTIISQTSGPSSKFVIQNVRHNPHKEVPDLILEKVSKFINHLPANEKKDN